MYIYNIITLIFLFLTTDICWPAGSEIAHTNGFQVCPYFIGHGIGSYFHCHPEIWHHGKFGSVVKWWDKLKTSLICETVILKTEINIKINDMLPKALFHSLFLANDNDMTLDEGMAFTIGEIQFYHLYMHLKVLLSVSVELISYVHL